MKRFAMASCALAVGLVGTGCHEGEFDGAVVRLVTVTQSNGLPGLGVGSDCTTVIRGTSHGQEGRITGPRAAFLDISEKGRVRTKVYIRPQGAGPDFELSVDNGDLARDETFNRESFVDQEVIYDTIVTWEDDIIDLEYFFLEDCEDEWVPGGGP